MIRRIKLRWWIFILLTLINLVNNFDRQVLAISAPTLQHDLGWGELEYGRMVSAFQASFAVMNLFLGRVIDRLGARVSMAASILWFSIAQIAHCFARTSGAFMAARVGLALGEAPVYPATLKAMAEWAPREERGIAAGVIHFGVMLGALAAPLVLPWLIVHYGWQSGFLLTGLMGFVVLIPFLALYRSPEDNPLLSETERDLILANRTGARADGAPLNWLGLFRLRQLWACVAIQSVVNPAWWFVIYWTPKFFAQRFDVKGVAMTPYLSTIFAMAAVGALAGSALSGLLFRRGFSLNASRKLTLLACGLVMPVVIVAAGTRSPWLAVAVIGIGAIVHQTWTTTGVAIFADLFPPRAVASVVGISSFCASLAGVAGAELTGRILQANPGHYTPMFAYAASAYLITTLIVHLLVPKLTPAPGI